MTLSESRLGGDDDGVVMMVVFGLWIESRT